MSHHRSRREFLGMGVGVSLGTWLASGVAPSQGAETAPATESDRAPGGGKRVYLMTDLEGVAGVLDSENWCKPESRNYDLAKEFLTLEVNAAIEGFARGGATEFLVADGHGPGAINPKLLDPRAQLARNWPSPPYPFSLEKGMDFAAWVGQHAMSRTEFAHLAHTGSFSVFETTINDKPVGEFGEVALCASQLGVRTIFGAGDLAFTKEAQALVPGIETVAVKRGTTPGTGDECDAESYAKRNLAAIHYQPVRVREMIRAGAERAIRRALADIEFGLLRFKPPFEKQTVLRRQGSQSKKVGRSSHPDNLIALMNAPMTYEPMKEQ